MPVLMGKGLQSLWAKDCCPYWQRTPVLTSKGLHARGNRGIDKAVRTKNATVGILKTAIKNIMPLLRDAQWFG